MNDLPTAWSGFLSGKVREMSMSRRQLLAFLAAVGAAVLSTCKPVEIPASASPGGPTASPAPPEATAEPAAAASPTPASLTATPPPALPTIEEPAAFEGYSIFHQTMVDMPWPAIKKAAEEGAIVLLPVAVIEEHGPHMGLGPDVYLTYLWSKLTRQALEARGIKTLIAPPYYWGINASTGSFPGSFSVRADTMKAVLYDIHASLRGWGFKYVFSLNLHGDPTHRGVLADGIQKAREGLGIGAYLAVIDAPPFPGAALLDRGVTDVHAGAYETGQMAAEFPMEVNTELAKTLEASTGFLPWGYYGDPAKYAVFNAEEVRKWGAAGGAATAAWIEDFLKKQK